MKIILMNNLYPPFNKGGAEKVVELTYKELKRQGYNSKIITTKPYKEKMKGSSSDIYHLNSLYYNLSSLPVPIRLFWHLADMFSFRKYYRIKKILKKEDPDLVITHNLKGLGHLTPRVIKKTSATHFHTLHDIQLLHPSGLLIFGQEKKIDTSFARLYQKINNFLFQKVDKVIAPSRWLLSLHTQKGFFPASSRQVAYNPLPDSFIPPQKNKDTPVSDRYTFLYAGQMEEHKGVELLLQAFQEFKKGTRTSPQLKLLGGGDKLQEWREYNDPDINFLGPRPPQEVIQEMEWVDCLVVPSLCYENSPTVIYEAVKTNTDVLASDLGGIPELTRSFYGELFRPNDKKDLVQKMKKMHAGRGTRAQEQKKLEDLTPKKYTEKILSQQ